MTDFFTSSIDEETNNIIKEPFPYFFRRGMFEPDTYEQILANLPDNRFYSPLGGTGDEPRLILDLRNEDSINELPKQQRSFWARMLESYLNEDFAHKLVDVLAPYNRPCHPYEKPALRFTAKLSRDTGNFKLGIHTDGPYRLISSLFYLAIPGNPEDIGTGLFVPREKGFRCSGGPHYVSDAFDFIGSAPFVPNSFFAFPISDTSFHGVDIGKRLSVSRNCLLFTVLYSHEGDLPPIRSFHEVNDWRPDMVKDPF